MKMNKKAIIGEGFESFLGAILVFFIIIIFLAISTMFYMKERQIQVKPMENGLADYKETQKIIDFLETEKNQIKTKDLVIEWSKGKTENKDEIEKRIESYMKERVDGCYIIRFSYKDNEVLSNSLGSGRKNNRQIQQDFFDKGGFIYLSDVRVDYYLKGECI
ncbi:MAG: hypothetical protein ACP5OG_04820 [Candidatus Nanoarchaeia archaeon]